MQGVIFKVSALQALAHRQEEEAREQELRAEQNKQQLALYHAALAAARAEAQAAADAQSEEEALQVSFQLQVFLDSVPDAQVPTCAMYRCPNCLREKHVRDLPS